MPSTSLRLRLLSFATWTTSVVAAGLLVAACGGNASEASPSADGGHDDAALLPDQGVVDARPSEAGQGVETGPPDGPPSYTSSCTPLSAQTGTALNTPHGRLDGYLSYIVPQNGSHTCNGDSSHVHLQVRMMGDVYDVAVDIGTFTGDANLYEADMPMPEGPWSEGWHNVPLGYPQLGIHSTQFTPEDPTTLGQKIETELAKANHISVFGSSYTQGNGCHDVHYKDGSFDGAIVIDPLSPKAHIMFFRFSTQSF